MTDFYLTAKREYCAACGAELGSARYLVQSKFSGKYEAIHHSQHCLELFQSRNRPDPLGPDTSNRALSARSP